MSSGTGIKTSRPVKHYKPASGKEVLIYNNSYIVLLLYTWINPISHCLFLPWHKSLISKRRYAHPKSYKIWWAQSMQRTDSWTENLYGIIIISRSRIFGRNIPLYLLQYIIFSKAQFSLNPTFSFGHIPFTSYMINMMYFMQQNTKPIEIKTHAIWIT